MPTKFEKDDWKKMATEQFGEDPRAWTFCCPRCGSRQNAWLFLHFNIPPKGRPYTSCIGRWVNTIGACDYSIVMSCLIVVPHRVLVFDADGIRPVFPFAMAALEVTADKQWLDDVKIERHRYYQGGQLVAGDSGLAPDGPWVDPSKLRN